MNFNILTCNAPLADCLRWDGPLDKIFCNRIRFVLSISRILSLVNDKLFRVPFLYLKFKNVLMCLKWYSVIFSHTFWDTLIDVDRWHVSSVVTNSNETIDPLLCSLRECHFSHRRCRRHRLHPRRAAIH